MKKHILTIAIILIGIRAYGAEAELMVSPRVTLSETKAKYSEELNNFYGTNAYLLQSSELAKRVLKTEAKQVPNTAVIKWRCQVLRKKQARSILML